MIPRLLTPDRLSLLLLSVIAVTAPSCAQDRQPAVAGQFYPADRKELTETLRNLFAAAVPSQGMKAVIAVIAPHAGYVFSGVVAASAYNQLDPDTQYENIFILAPSHQVGFEGAAVFTKGDYVTPLGRVRVNKQAGKALAAASPLFVERTDAHLYEHSLEVQLPFLQYRLKKGFQIVPIVLGQGSPETYAALGAVLKPYLASRNLFVVSTDFSHYPAYDDAKDADGRCGRAILTNSAGNVVRAIRENEERGIRNLVTSMCGEAGVLTLLTMTQGNPKIAVQELQYRNSGDSPHGEKNNVVGYHAIAFCLKEEIMDSGFRLDDKDKKDLLAIARTTLDEYIRHGRLPTIDPAGFSQALKTNCGAFVTLKEHGALRGCIGRFEPNDPLCEVVQQMAVAASTEDPRFQRVTASELSDIDVEISVLTPMKRISSIDEFELGKHGIYIKKGFRSGTFLPQVAVETGWTKEEFFGHCSRDKAGLGWDGWKEAELYTYEAIIIEEAKK